MPKQQQVPVTKRALVQRVSRALKKEQQQLVVARGRAIDAVGEFYITDGAMVVEKNVNLERKARALGVLAPYERLEEE